MIIRENISFERGLDPKQSMDIGLFAKINKITSSDLEFLKIYTNNGDGKGNINLELFHEVYESSSSYEEYLERVKEVYKLLEPYEYLFGDNFESDMKKEMKEYVKSYLKNPKYNYAYNCDIMEEGDFDVFFCEIELPSAEFLGKTKKRISESLDFKRGGKPLDTLRIGMTIGDKFNYFYREFDKAFGDISEEVLSQFDGENPTERFIGFNIKHVNKKKIDEIKKWFEEKMPFFRFEKIYNFHGQYKIHYGFIGDSTDDLDEAQHFERGVDPKQTLGIGVKEKIRQGILGLLKSSRGDTRIATINIGKNREDTWLDISDYGTKNFENLFYSFLSPEYFKNEIYLKVKPKKFSKSWKDDWRVFIKDEYKDFFKACFNPEGYIIESVNFERGIEPKRSMRVGVHRNFTLDVEFGDELEGDDEHAEMEKETAQYWTWKGIWATSARGVTNNENTRINIQLSNGDLIIFDEFRPSGAGGSEYVKSGYFEYDIMKMGQKFFNHRTTGEDDELCDQYQEFFSEGSELGAILKTYEFIMSGGLNETVNFERGGDPMDTMEIGRIEERKQKLIDEIIKYDATQWTGSSVLIQYIVIRFGITPQWHLPSLEEASIEDLKKALSHLQKWDEIDKKRKTNEALNFERGMDPKTSMKIGGIRPIDQLKKDYDRIIELIQTKKYLDFQTSFTTEASDLLEANIHFGWGNIHNNFKNMNREELYPFEILVQKYTNLLGI